MASHPRRQFLKRSVAAASGLALSTACELSDTKTGDATSTATQPVGSFATDSMVAAVARIVLPSAEMTQDELGEEVQSFRDWVEGFQPVAEQNLPYLVTDVIPYGPPHPGPQWQAQLDALDLEANHRFERKFADLDAADQLPILRRQLPKLLPDQLPRTAHAPHIAIAIMSHFFHSSKANDLCYSRAIGRQTCRGLDTAAAEPQRLNLPGRG